MSNTSYPNDIINSALDKELTDQRWVLKKLEDKIKYIENFDKLHIAVHTDSIILYKLEEEEIVFDVIQVILFDLNLKIHLQKEKILELEKYLNDSQFC
jgi:hypothetical protein